MKSAKTDLDQVELEEKRNLLSRRLSSWLTMRKDYIPLIDNNDLTTAPDAALPEDVELRLPSSLPEALWDSCPFQLAAIEHRFRKAQAEDNLADLHQQLHVAMGLTHYKVTQVGSSQRSSTRALSLMAHFREKTWQNVERYRVARIALEALDPDGDWKDYLCILKDEDVRGLGKGDGESESRHKILWIWRVEGSGGLGLAQEATATMSNCDLDDCESFHVL
jgi:hypothetical protein